MLIFDTKNSYATIIVLGSLTVFIFMFWGYSQIFNSINDQVDIDVQIDKWEQTLPNSYDYTVVAGCMSLVTSKAAVRNGKHSFSLDSEKIMLSELFNIAKKAKNQAYKIEIDYNENYGFPSLIDIDWSSNVIDDECFYEVTKFEVIEL